ncbi:MAG TPA: hypothetical protein VFS88_09700 [Micavibrio sp.]|nr:hypothetical protein [Micavibrio sp.]
MTQNEENTPKLPVKPPLSRRLMHRFEETLEENFSTLPTGVMVEQMAILDITFRQGLHYALSGSMDAPVFHAALKAQNQYRYTLKALNSFDNAQGKRRET